MQQWFETFDDGQWKEHAHKFVGLNGRRICGMTEQQFISEIPGFSGRAIFNDVRKLVKQGVSVLLVLLSSLNVNCGPRLALTLFCCALG